MTSLAAAVQAVDSAELLESLHAKGNDGPVTDPGPTSETSSRPAEKEVLDRWFERIEPGLRDAVGVPSFGKAYPVAKRATDIFGSLFLLAVLTPLVAVIAALIKLSDGGPVFYPHLRVGKWGREFLCLKFRTMVVNADHLKPEIPHLNTHEDDRTFKVPDDPRITRIGRFLRRSSLDEVPQLWNVLKGSMSLVGRPPVVQEVELYDLDDMQRLMVKPGLTCIWQVSGRSLLPFSKQLELDMEYIQKRGYWFDLKLMFKTLPAVFSADGAYSRFPLGNSVRVN